MGVKFANPPLELGLKYHDPPHLTELKEKCSRLFKVQYSKPTRKKKNKIKAKQKKLGQKEWKLTAKDLLKPLHLSKNRMMLQSLLPIISSLSRNKWAPQNAKAIYPICL